MHTTFVRLWCVWCLNETVHRRYGDEEILNAKLECTTHQPRPSYANRPRTPQEAPCNSPLPS